MASTPSEIGTFLDQWSEAMQMKDIDQLMSFYAPDAVYFDVVPPLQIAGADGVRRNFLRWFDGWESRIGVEIRDLKILVNGNVASAHMLHRTSGTLKVGRDVGYWVRVTVSCRRSSDKWMITHEHVSLPVDIKSGRVVMDLLP